MQEGMHLGGAEVCVSGAAGSVYARGRQPQKYPGGCPGLGFANIAASPTKSIRAGRWSQHMSLRLVCINTSGQPAS